jgi:hypothetical protein
VKQLNEYKDAILFIDEIHTLIGAGSASGGTLDASNPFLKLLHYQLDQLNVLVLPHIRNIELYLKKIMHSREDFRKSM